MKFIGKLVKLNLLIKLLNLLKFQTQISLSVAQRSDLNKRNKPVLYA